MFCGFFGFLWPWGLAKVVLLWSLGQRKIGGLFSPLGFKIFPKPASKPLKIKITIQEPKPVLTHSARSIALGKPYNCQRRADGWALAASWAKLGSLAWAWGHFLVGPCQKVPHFFWGFLSEDDGGNHTWAFFGHDGISRSFCVG